MSNMKQDFDIEQFEHRLENLKDTQDGIQQMSSWCLQHRSNHKKIVTSWLNVLKKVRVEHRLVLFYLANDVIQYSKRKRYEFVESWATALQRATTMVRDDKVRNKIFRIFKIWEQRGIYSEEYLSDLGGLLSMNPSKKSQSANSAEINSMTEEFQSSTLISNIRDCVDLSSTTDKSFKNMPKAPNCDIENIKTALKDRSHSDDVEKELDRYVLNIENHRKNLAAEIKSRKALLSSLETAITFYTNQRGEVKVVVSAYKNFGSRIKLVKKKLDEITPNLPSPLPSPDINAPSPEPDSDINLPGDQSPSMNIFKSAFNGYTSYLDGKLPFDINDFKRGDSDSPKKSSALSASRPIEVIASRSDSDSLNESFSGPDFYKPEPLNPMGSINPYSASSITLPVPSGQSEYSSIARSSAANYTSSALPYGGHTSNRYNPMVPNYASDSSYISNSSNNSYDVSMPLMPPPMPPSLGIASGGSQNDDFNSTWDLDMSWTPLDTSNPFNHCIDTPISPGHFDRDSILDDSVIDYDDHDDDIVPMQDVDHRQLHLPVPIVAPLLPNLGPNIPRHIDIDHRNLISLTGSPTPRDNEDIYKRTNKTWVAPKDKDFRTPLPVQAPTKQPVPQTQPQTPSAGDIDYRTLSTSKSESKNAIKTTPAPHPPLKPPPMLTGLLSFTPQATEPESSSSKDSNRKGKNEISVSEPKSEEDGYDPSDMVESIDMDMSDEDLEDIFREVASVSEEFDQNEKEKEINKAQEEREQEPEKDQEKVQEKDVEQQDEEQEKGSETDLSSEDIDNHSELDEYVPESMDESRCSRFVPVKNLHYRDNLISVSKSRPPLLETPPTLPTVMPNNNLWENQQSLQGSRFQTHFEENSGNQDLAADNAIHNNNMRPHMNPWKQTRMPFRMSVPLDNHHQQQQQLLSPGGFHHPPEFQHHQQFPRFQRNPMQQPPRNFGQHMPPSHFRGSPRPPRGNPFFRARGRGGIPGSGPPVRGNMFRGKFRGNPWQ